jgi:hypothetical protein
MNVVLCCLHNFQPYILDNIQQLKKLGHTSIYVLTHERFFFNFENVTLINVDELHDSFHFYERSSLNKTFRNGFWILASLRFFYIYEFMKTYQIKDVIHLENDVPIYYHCDELKPFLKERVYLPFDTYYRNIASIMYIPNDVIFKRVLDQYNFSKNDMENFSDIQKTGLIENFPIYYNDDGLTKEQQFVSSNSDIFPFLFDAAAMGQLLGGIDPKNTPGNTTGFVNETCVIKYKNLCMENCKPYLMIHDVKHRVFNLHIHSKKLKHFI